MRTTPTTDDPDQPWNCIPPELWRKMLAIAFAEEPFDPSDMALDAGLNEEQTAAFKAWCHHVDFDDFVRRETKPLSAADKRFVESIGLELAPHTKEGLPPPKRKPDGT